MSSNTYRIVLWGSVLGTLAIVIIGMVWLAKGGGQPQVYVPGVNEILADDYVKGSADAKLTIVEYSDFQCPACAAIYPTVKKIMDEKGDQVRLVYRNFPIPGHYNGIPAAYAAGAAGLQGKFFEMADMILTHQTEWSAMDAGTLNKTLDSYAQTLGLDMNKFKTDMVSDAVKAKVKKDAESGEKAGVNSTPSFFINGTKLELKSYDDLRTAVDAALLK